MTKIEMKPQYWAILLLLGWIALTLLVGLARSDNYGLSEGGALNLLLGWSASAQQDSPIIRTGNLDFRLLPDYFLGLYWNGSLMAARVLNLLFYFFAVAGLYAWSRRLANDESAKLASGLMLIVPVAFQLSNSLDLGPLLLLLFVVADQLNRRYQDSPHVISAWYFLQLITAAACLMLHPMGLAYPLLLAWQWFTRRSEQPQKLKAMAIGLFAVLIIVLAMQAGWIDVKFGASPVQIWNDALSGHNALDSEHGWLLGSIASLLFLVTLYFDRKSLLNKDLMLSILALASVIGAFFADLNWALIATAYLFYRGIDAMLQLNRRIGQQSFGAQRGVSMAALLIMCFIFTQSDRALVVANKSEVLSPQDELIKTFAKAVENNDDFYAASEWPARTMMATKGRVFRLPPAQADGKQLLEKIGAITHIIFDPNQPKNHDLSKNLSQVNQDIKTVAIQEGGVIIAIRNPAVSRLPNAKAKKKVLETNPASDLPKQK